MPLIRIEMKKGKSKEYKKTMLDCVHSGLVEAFGIEEWDRFQRIIEIDKDDFETAPEKTDDFMIVELTIFPGRSKEQKKKAIELITAELGEKLSIAPSDIFIVMSEPPLENWGMGGYQKGQDGSTECYLLGEEHGWRAQIGAKYEEGLDMVLLVVDAQRGCFNESLYAFETVKENVKKLIAEARVNNNEVIYVQHDDGPGTDLDGETAYKYYNEFMWPVRYAQTVSVEETIEMMRNLPMS